MKYLFVIFAFLPACIFTQDEQRLPPSTFVLPTVIYQGNPVDLDAVKFAQDNTIRLVFEPQMQVNVEGALSQQTGKIVEIVTSDKPVTITAQDRGGQHSWTIQTTDGGRVTPYHYCGKNGIYRTNTPVFVGLERKEDRTPVLGRIEDINLIAVNMDQPDYEVRDNQIILSGFPQEQNGSLVINEVILGMVVLSTSDVEVVEQKPAKEGQASARFFQRNQPWCHQPPQYDECQWVNTPNATSDAHVVASPNCILR